MSSLDPHHTSQEEVKNIVHDELIPIRKDVNDMRKMAMMLLIAVVGGLFGYGVWVGTIQQRVSNVERNFDVFEQRLETWLIRIEDKIDRINNDN